MTSSHLAQRIYMARYDLASVAEVLCPPQASLRWYQPGDEAHWARIHLEADRYSLITPELFVQEFGTDPAELARRQCYILWNGEVVGTATAWYDDDFGGARWGRVHWVAVLPEYQGIGLSKPLLSFVCRRLHQLGHERAYLVTAPLRVRAIRLYLRFGFKPYICDPSEAWIWQVLRQEGRLE